MKDITYKEIFLSNGELVNYEEWKNTLTELYEEKQHKESEEEIVVKVKNLIEKAIINRANIETKKNVGIFFSGGLDSSLIAAICKKNKIKFTCYTVGFQDGNMGFPEDIKHAINVAKHLKLSNEEFKYKIFNLKEIEEILNKTAYILRDVPEKTEINPIVNLGVAGVEVAAYSISNNEKLFFSGIGSEEIFAGYERHKNNPTNKECFDGLIKMYNRDILRDFTVSKNLRFSFLTPFLDIELIKYALKIPIKYKLNSYSNKIILRKAAHEYLGEHAERLKKAAQYGSSFDKAIAKLTAKKGFKTKKEYYKNLTKNYIQIT